MPSGRAPTPRSGPVTKLLCQLLPVLSPQDPGTRRLAVVSCVPDLDFSAFPSIKRKPSTCRAITSFLFCSMTVLPRLPCLTDPWSCQCLGGDDLRSCAFGEMELLVGFGGSSRLSISKAPSMPGRAFYYHGSEVRRRVLSGMLDRIAGSWRRVVPLLGIGRPHEGCRCARA